MYVCTCVYIILYICVCVLYILLYIIETFIWHMVVDLKAFIRNGPCHIQGPLVPHIITTPFTAPDACLHPQRQTWHSHAPPHCGGILTCQARRESRQVDTPPSWMLGKLPSECWKTHQGSLRNKMIYKWSTNDGFVHMSGGQNYFLPAMDMAKVGPLSRVKVYISMLCVKIGYL